MAKPLAWLAKKLKVEPAARLARDSIKRAGASPGLRAFRHRDFSLLWLGAMVSFTGVQVQSIAQGYIVYEMTGNEAMLGFVMFATLLPVSLFGPILGVFSDVLDRRKIMVVASVILASGAAFLGYAAHTGFLQYWHIIAVAVMGGFVLTIE
ncbi:MAG: MFS transporter, partial [Armatimonadetes bacterium]|nr:MFS transporter [Armatimonadota bacterium]